MIEVRFSPVGLTSSVEAGTTVLDAARRVGVDLSSVCGGRQTCRRCVVVIDGEPTLGCSVRVSQDLSVDVPASSGESRPVVRKAIEVDSAAIDPIVPVSGTGQKFGVAIDVGSTTVAAHLCDLYSGQVMAGDGIMNPQIRFGDDLMSRVSYVMMNPGGADQLTEAIRQALGQLVESLLASSGIDRGSVAEVVLVGNPIMHHLVLGYDPVPLGMAPFTLHTDQPVTGQATDLGMDLPQASFYFGPCIAGHVGADTSAAILAEQVHHSDQVQLLVDVGTNAEIVLGDRHRIFAASSPTGPAFEGAEISHGQRATPGAIERVRIDPATGRPRFKVIGHDLWSDHPDFSATVTGICGSGIIEVIAEMRSAGIIDPDGTIVDPKHGSGPDSGLVIADGRTFSYVLYDRDSNPILVTQNDVRAIQLAKAALRAGIELLLDHAGRPEINDIRLAGAFGAHIDPARAQGLGLIPPTAVANVKAVGNAAGVGAVLALLSQTARREMEAAVREVIKIETATEPRFQELFVAAMGIPHGAKPTSDSTRPKRRRGRARRPDRLDLEANKLEGMNSD